MATKHAVALRAFDHAGDGFAPGPAFPLAAGYLADWSAAGLVREASPAEIAKLKGDAPARRAPAKRGRKAKAVPTPAPAPGPADAGDASADPVGDPDPAAPAA